MKFIKPNVPYLEHEDRVLGGVASGIAIELGVPPIAVRAALIVLAVAGGWGFTIYTVMWGWSSYYWYRHSDQTPIAPDFDDGGENQRLLGFGMVIVGLLFAAQEIGIAFVPTLVRAASLLALGSVVAWHRGVFPDTDTSRRRAILRMAIGLLLAVGGAILIVASNLDGRAAISAVAAVLILVTGVAVVLGPWISRAMRQLGDERRARIRSEERADVAAHIHDSVLQTLALIQRQSDDPQAMVSLARRQERDLRDWLFADEAQNPADSSMFRREFTDAAFAVEELHHVPIEVVVVGDCTLDHNDRVYALIGAAKEAMVNASMHSGADTIDVYAEVTDDVIEVFIRDTGRGFDPGAIPDDHRGVTQSIVGRMRRVGGSTIIDTAIDRGTEIALTLPLSPTNGPTVTDTPERAERAMQEEAT